MKNDLTTLAVTLFFALGIAIVSAPKAAAFDLIYCQAPDGSVRALSTSYASDCKSLAKFGSKQINETRGKALFEAQSQKALGIDSIPLQHVKEASQGDLDIQPAGQ